MLFDGQDLGFSYRPGSTLPDPMTYTPQVEVGMRIPHLAVLSAGDAVKVRGGFEMSMWRWVLVGWDWGWGSGNIWHGES